jgi:hypothetical protein
MQSRSRRNERPAWRRTLARPTLDAGRGTSWRTRSSVASRSPPAASIGGRPATSS